MATATRQDSAPQAWLQPGGLILAFLGFVVAAFAYTGPRIYDVKFFWVALVGFVLMLGGVLVAGWGRVMVSRPRKRKAAARAKAKADAPAEDASPAKKAGLLARLKRAPKHAASSSPFAGWKRRDASVDASADERPERAEGGKKSPFSGWKRKSPAPADAPERESLETVPRRETVGDAPAAREARAEAAPAPVDGLEEAPVPPVPAPPEGNLPVKERLTVECPRCKTTFTVEGTRPITMRCTKCHLTGTIN